ncbi:hypothetical protein J6590_074911 [Homalodisca vitripennis]|nr:hypothetical protein J6590_074911 [Homalodisca vitripennis]
MYPVNTGRKPSSENFCSSIMHKIRWRSQERYPSGDQGQRTAHSKMKSAQEYTLRGNSDKCNHDGKRIKDIKYVAKKVRRVTSSIPLVIRSGEAYEVGVEGCESCTLGREGYKKILQSIKIIEILVDGVIEKEQTDLLDSKEIGLDDGFGEGDKSNLKKGSSYDEQPSREKDVNVEKDAVDHNLKCILIMLQKCIGDTLVQICYVKSKNLTDDKKYRHFNIPISDLKLLKFEFTNLTHIIIQLFKKNVKGSKVDEDMCVLCVKEKLIDCQGRLVDELKSGRNLKVVMKNGKARENEQPCCSREYPHVHAEAEGNPIVLKYSLPFQVNKTPEKDVPLDKPTTKQKTTPSKSGSKNVSDIKESPKDSDEKVQENKPVENNSQPIDYSTTGNTNGQQKKEIPINKITKPIPYDQWPDEVGDETEVKSAEKVEIDHTIPLEGDSPLEVEKDSKIDSSNVSDIPERQSQCKDIDTVKNTSSPENINETISDAADEVVDDELYCGCNFDKVFEKLKIKLPSTSDRVSLSNSSVSTDSFNTNSSYKDVGKRGRSNKKVSFMDNNKFYPIEVKNPNTVFDVVPEAVSGGKEKDEEFSNKTPFGETTREAPVYLTAVDSIILAKQRLSSCEHEHSEIKDFLEDKEVVCAFKQFIPTSEYVVHVATQDKTNIRDILPKSRTHMSKRSKIIEDILKDVDSNTIRELHTDPDCYGEYALKEYGSESNLPISTSIRSLPLDHDDLNSISAFLGKDMSQAEIMLVSDEDTTDQMCVWETQYDDQSTEENRTKWLRAFAGTENPSHHLFTTLPEPRRERSSLRRSVVKGYRTREVHQTLPTIAEEVAFVVDDEDFHIPYVPSISSLPLNEVELNELLKKKHPLAKHKTMELRYFTVEFPQTDKSNKSSPQENQILNNSSSFDENKIPSSNESFHSCCSSISDLCTDIVSKECLKKDKQTLSPYKETNSTLKAVDEMIMLNAIFLSDGYLEDKKTRSLTKNSPQDIYKLATYNFVTNRPCNSFVSNGSVTNFNPRKLSYTIIEDNYSQCCVSTTDKDKPLVTTTNVQKYNRVTDGFNRFTHCERNTHKYSSEKLNDSNEKDSIDSSIHFEKNKSYTILRNSDPSSLDYNIPNIDNYKFTYLRNSARLTDANPYQPNINQKQEVLDSATPSTFNSCPRINRSYTIINSKNHINLPHILSPAEHSNEIIKPNTITRDTLDTKRDCVVNGNNTDLMHKANSNLVKFTQSNECMADDDKNIAPDAVEWCREELNKVISEHSKYINKSLRKENVSGVKVNCIYNDNFYSAQSTEICEISGYKAEQNIVPNIRRSSYPRVPFSDNVCIEERITPPQSIISKLCELLETEKGTLMSSIKNLETSKMAEGDISIKFGDFQSVEKNPLQLGDDGSINNKKDFGFEKQYISVKKCPINKTDTCKIKFELTLDEKSHANDQKENSNTKDNSKTNLCQSTNCKMDLTDVRANVVRGRDTLMEATQIIEAKCSSCSFMSDRRSGDHTSKAWYLYDASGLPLTDNSGRLLRKNNGELLVVCDAAGIPISDADRNPIYDAYGRSPGNSQFNPSKPLSIDILKTLTTAAGSPISVYDIKGRPLTSVSGTMLFDCTGRGLIRYGSHGSPISDLSGKPLFDAYGRQITD